MMMLKRRTDLASMYAPSFAQAAAPSAPAYSPAANQAAHAFAQAAAPRPQVAGNNNLQNAAPPHQSYQQVPASASGIPGHPDAQLSHESMQLLQDFRDRQAMSATQKMAADRGVFAGGQFAQPMAAAPSMNLPALYKAGL